jgi:CRP-like cAMP-binding protein
MVQDSPFARKLSTYFDLSPEDLRELEVVYNRRRKFRAGQDLISQGQNNHSAYILEQGWACSYVILPNGGRQIVAFHIPGDMLGQRSVLFRGSDHSVEPITPIEACEVLVSDLMEAFTKTPKLATAVLWASSRDVAMLVGNLVGMGRRTAAQRTAHCLLELGIRLRELGLGETRAYACPLTQYQLADALGLSAVHVNRVLRDMHEAGLMTFQKGKVRFDDFDRLVAFADFDRAYLDDAGPMLHWPLTKYIVPPAPIRLPQHKGR